MGSTDRRERFYRLLTIGCVTLAVILAAIYTVTRLIEADTAKQLAEQAESVQMAVEAPLPDDPFDYSDAVDQLPADTNTSEARVKNDDQSHCDQLGIAGRLVIPALCVSAQLVDVSIVDGQMEIPEDISQVGLWRGSGQRYVIAGHVDNRAQGQGVLFQLHQAQPGDLIYTDLDSQMPTQWQVVSLSSYPKGQIPAEVFTGTGDQPSLTVITCGGAFLSAQGEYTDNVLIKAVAL